MGSAIALFLFIFLVIAEIEFHKKKRSELAAYCAKKICECEKQIRDLKDELNWRKMREKSACNTLPAILEGVFRKVMDRIQMKDRWESITPELFERDAFFKCENALDELRIIYRNGGLDRYDGGEEVKREICGYLDDAYWELDEDPQDTLRRFVRKINIESWRHMHPDSSDNALNDMIPVEVLDEFLYCGMEEFVRNYDYSDSAE